jgi:palmitoyltransferase
MVKQQVKDSVFGARFFYFAISLGILAIFVAYDNDLSFAIRDGHWLYVGAFFGNFALSFYLFLRCGTEPGFLDIDKEKESGNLDLILPDVNGDIEQGSTIMKSANRYVDITENPEDPRDSLKETLLRDRHFCNVCNVVQPVRTKHCDLCERCVHKYDHHCFWIGSCVGEFNHRKFWLFLFFQTVTLLWAFIIADSGLDSYKWVPRKYTNNDNTSSENMSSGYTSEYGAFMVCCLFTFLFTIFTGALLGYHTYLLLTNQSTWEFTRRSQISYLRGYPKGFLPFDKGAWQNIKMAFFHNHKRREWVAPSVEYAKSHQTFNWCDNQYYSCC